MRRKVGKWKKIASALLTAAMVVTWIPVGSVNAENGSTATSRELLGMTLDYCAEMDSSKYTEASYATFTDALTQAQAAYDENALSDEEFYELRDTLEKAKAELEFIADSQAVANPTVFRELSVNEIVAEMGTGWNLGNTMDGHTGFTPNETLWQNVETTKELIKSVHDLGFNTVRVPITWGTMINDEDYSIDETWMSRVQDIVDYGIAQDMYVIINIHHDGAEQTGWLRVAADDIDSVYEKYEGVWRTIANRFKDYDEHLIFESMNEVQGDESTGVPHDTEVIMNLNQIFVNVVRATGSNNTKRFLSVPGRYTNIENTTKPENGFELPKDIVENRIFVAVHYYDWQFGMAENTTATTWSYNSALALQRDFQKLVDSFTSKGIPVILGEYGCINKNNPLDRAYHIEVVNRMSSQGGIVPVYWDQGWYDRSLEPTDYSYTLVDRNTGETIDKEVTDAIMRGMFVSGASDLSDIVVGTPVTEINDVELPDRMAMTIDESTKIEMSLSPAETNDVLLWSTDDSTIATVYNGNVRARGIGTTTIHAYSQSGSFEKAITVTVSALETEASDQAITTAYDSGITVEEGKSVYLEAVLSGSDANDFLTYKSADESIATVSSIGKVVGKEAGTTYVILTAASGMTKVIPVTVEQGEEVKEIRLALNVYFNDSDTSYFSNEYGQAIEVSGDGEYELTFDCATDLSDKATAAGVTGLNNLTAVYIKDQSVTEGKAKISPLDSCNIMFNSVIVDGVELTVTQTEPKSALKASGIFDTNDPLNSWDGSQVEEVTVDNHVLNIVGVDNPQKITVKFTLSDMIFTEGAVMEDTAQAAVVNQINVPESMNITSDPGTQTLELTIDGDDGAKLTVVPADASIVSVDTTALTVQGGKATIQISPLKTGATTITVYADNGTTASFALDAQVTIIEEENLSDEDTADVDAGQDANVNTNNGDADNESINHEDESEADKSDKGSNKKSEGTNWVLIIMVALVAAVAAGFGAYFVTNKLDSKKKADTSRDEKKEESKESEK